MKFFTGRFGIARGSDDTEKDEGYGALSSQDNFSIDFSDKEKDGSPDSNDEDGSSSEDESFAGDYDEKDVSLMESKDIVQTNHVARRVQQKESRGVLAHSNSFDPNEVGAQLMAMSGHSRTRTNKEKGVRCKSNSAVESKAKTLSLSNHSCGRARRSVRRSVQRRSVGPGISLKDLMKNMADDDENTNDTESQRRRRSLKNSHHKRRFDRKQTGSLTSGTEDKKRAGGDLISESLHRELELLADSSSSEDELHASEEEAQEKPKEEEAQEKPKEEEVAPKRRTSRTSVRRKTTDEEKANELVARSNTKKPSLAGLLNSTQPKAEDTEEVSVGGTPKRSRVFLEAVIVLVDAVDPKSGL